jgi:DNA polymerase III alpha subunit
VVHSQWSLLDGVPSVGAIVDFAHAASLPAIALTDTNALPGAGAIEFISVSRKVGIASTPALHLWFVQVQVSSAQSWR